MMSFEEWFKEANKTNDCGFTNKDFYEAGAASRQAEVDELQNSIGVLEDTISYALKFIDGDKYPHAIKELEGVLNEN